LNVTQLVQGGVVLRAIERADLSMWREWINDAEIAAYLDRALPVTEPEHEDFFEKSVIGNSGAVWFAIEAGEPKHYVGNIWLWAIHHRHRTAELRIIIGDRSVWGSGVGSTAIGLITAYAFRTLGLEKIYAYTMNRNPRAARSFEKAGWSVEAKLRGEVFWDGKREDVFRHACWKDGPCPPPA
jgi:RimJ/RimL family protein N-acetyltransferase